MTPSSATELEAVKDELLPCPFCGARLQRQETTSGHWHEHMGEVEDCYATGSIVFDQTIAAWNRRASPTPPTVAESVTVAPAAGVREAEAREKALREALAIVQVGLCSLDGGTYGASRRYQDAILALLDGKTLPAQPNSSENDGIEKAAAMVAALRDDSRQEPMGFTEIAARIRALATNPEPKL